MICLLFLKKRKKINKWRNFRIKFKKQKIKLQSFKNFSKEIIHYNKKQPLINIYLPMQINRRKY